MFAVRYVALVALVLLMGVGVNLFDLFSRHPHWIAAACGAVIMISLFVMKFVGPPPHAFVLRATLAFVIILSSLYAGWLHTAPQGLLMTNLALSLVLLGWYARE